MTTLIKQIDLTKIDETSFKNRFSGCIVLTHDNKILFQQRGEDWVSHPGCIATFGGRIEQNETSMQALIRELKEELGADVNESDAIFLGAVTEAFTDHTELVYNYFWHDKNASITGCYEGQSIKFDTVDEVLSDPNIMDDIPWLLRECQKRSLII